MTVRDGRSDVKQTTTGFRGPLMVQSLTSAKSKFLSLRVKRFYASHVYSIIKKKHKRDERLKALPEDDLEITSPLRVEYIERKLIHKV